MAHRPPGPPAATSRPPEPLRPLPARRPGVGLLAAQARRRRRLDPDGRPPFRDEPGR